MTLEAKVWMRDFFAALHRRDLATCTTQLQRIARVAAAQPAWRPWHDYFEAVLQHEQEGDLAQAERRYRELLQHSGADRFLYGQIQISLAIVAMQMGDYASGIQAAQSASASFAQIADQLEQAKANAQLGLAYYLGHSAGEFDARALTTGIEACRTALDLVAQVEVGDQVDDVTALVWNSLGLLHTNLLQWEQAVDCYQQLHTICQRHHNEFGGAIAQANLGQAYHKVGKIALAQPALTAALTTFRKLERPYEALLVMADMALLYQALEQPAEALAVYAQALALVETVRANISGDAARAGFTATVSDLFANAVLCCVAARDYAQAFAYVEQARARAFLDLLGAPAPELEPRSTIAPLSLAEVQAALPADAILLEYFTTGLIEAPDRFTPVTIVAERPSFPRATTLLFVVTQTTLAVYDTLISPNDLYPSAVNAPVEEYFLDPAMRSALYEQLLAPAKASLRDKQIVYLVPHGPLHYVPFQALMDANGETLLQPGGAQIIYTSSASILLRRGATQATPNTPRSSPTRSCLALGCNSVESAIQLRYTEEEALAVAALTGGEAWIGAQPKKMRLFATAKNYRMLHFSCHGAFDPAAPLNSVLELAEHEVLTAQEVIDHLRLSGALVTLSACASGLSRVRRGDELYGLVRAFMIAGATALVVTQWRVDERAAYLLVSRFYELLREGHDPATALHRAQWHLRTLKAEELQQTLTTLLAGRASLPSALRADLSHWQAQLQIQPAESQPFDEPYYWAPFILIYG